MKKTIKELNFIRKRFEEIINCNSMENESNTPDYILAEFLIEGLAAFDKATKKRDEWYANFKINGGKGIDLKNNQKETIL